jgi:uncharacterized alpha-E superfamily protein
MPVSLRYAMTELYHSLEECREKDIAEGRAVRLNPRLEALLKQFSADMVDLMEQQAARLERKGEPR